MLSLGEGRWRDAFFDKLENYDVEKYANALLDPDISGIYIYISF